MHPVDALIAYGGALTPEREAELRAICDKPVGEILDEIRKRDSECVTYSDGTIHCSEPGDNVAADRRQLLGITTLLFEALTRR